MQQPIDPEKSVEPSVLDYVRSRLRFWEKDHLSLEQAFGDDEIADETAGESETDTLVSVEDSKETAFKLPWLVLLALLLALLAQVLLEPAANRTYPLSVFFYGAAAAVLIWSMVRKELALPERQPEGTGQAGSSMRFDLLIAAMVIGIIVFFLFGGGKFNFFNVILWLTAVGLVCAAFRDKDGSFSRSWVEIRDAIKAGKWQVMFTPWRILVLLVFGMIVYLRFYQLNNIPSEMISDQAERVLSVANILNREYPIFFPRSTTSEPLSFYWSALISGLFGFKGSFLALKAASAAAGLAMLYYLYHLGKLLGGRWTGLFALLFGGIAFWPNIQARAALGGIYFPLFLVMSMYYLFRGLHKGKHSDLILAGLATGAGLLSSREFLVVPLLNLVLILIYWLHHRKQGKGMQVLWAVIIMLLIGLISFVPVLRMMIKDPESYMFRIFSRLSNWERELPDNEFVIFFRNLWAALVMPFWSNASSWVDGVTRRPALDLVSAAIFMLGLVSLVIRYIKSRDWMDLALLLSYPLLLLPSVLSLAFPEENPSLSRAAGSMIPIFLMSGFGLASLGKSMVRTIPGKMGSYAAGLLALLLFIPSVSQNYRIVFNDYRSLYQQSSTNTTEMGAVVRQFADTIGSYDRVWVIGYPYWVDSRTLAIEAGLPGQDLSIPFEQLALTRTLEGNKMFLLHVNDAEGRAALLELFPEGILSEYTSKLENKNFMIFTVPALSEADF